VRDRSNVDVEQIAADKGVTAGRRTETQTEMILEREFVTLRLIHLRAPADLVQEPAFKRAR
jgi:hypothetical protein